MTGVTRSRKSAGHIGGSQPVSLHMLFNLKLILHLLMPNSDFILLKELQARSIVSNEITC